MPDPRGRILLAFVLTPLILALFIGGAGLILANFRADIDGPQGTRMLAMLKWSLIGMYWMVFSAGWFAFLFLWSLRVRAIHGWMAAGAVAGILMAAALNVTGQMIPTGLYVVGAIMGVAMMTLLRRILRIRRPRHRKARSVRA